MKRTALLSLFVCSALLFGCTPTTSPQNDLVAYAVEVENNQIKPQGLDFGMTAEEVCKIRNLRISDLRELSENTTSLSRIITIEGLSDTVQETFSFYDGKLVSATYNAIVGEDAFEALITKILTQADNVFPESLRHGECRWADAQGNWVIIDSGSTDEDSAKEFISLRISIPKVSV